MTSAYQRCGVKKYLRLFDANLNRAREGLRVIEDTARFVLINGKVFAEARAARHRLDKITRNIYPALLKERDSRSDKGRIVKESKRPGLKALLSANFRRVEEALRALEEYSKLVAPKAAPAFKEIRFKTYILEQEYISQVPLLPWREKVGMRGS
jgi:thiamine-phosphate pyrophosphorylase